MVLASLLVGVSSTHFFSFIVFSERHTARSPRRAHVIIKCIKGSRASVPTSHRVAYPITLPRHIADFTYNVTYGV